MTDAFHEKLRDAFPEDTDASVVRTINGAVALADDVRKNTPWLKTLIGDDLHGSLRRAAAMWRFEQACLSGELPFTATQTSNSTGSSHLLRVTSGIFEAHVIRTDSEAAFPKDAPIRQDKRLKNQSDLFDDPIVVPIRDILSIVEDAYAWLTFNADKVGAITHVCWCMPDAEEKKFLARVNVLRSAAERAATGGEEYTPPKIDPRTKLKFREHVAEQIEKIEKLDGSKGK